MLKYAMRNPIAVIAAALPLACSGVELATRLGTELLPELHEGSL